MNQCKQYGPRAKPQPERMANAECALSPSREPPRETAIANITEQLNGRLGALHSLNSRLVSLSDRLLGTRPEDGTSGATPGGPTCQIENLSACLPFLDYLLDQLGTQVSRLEQL